MEAGQRENFFWGEGGRNRQHELTFRESAVGRIAGRLIRARNATTLRVPHNDDYRRIHSERDRPGYGIQTYHVRRQALGLRTREQIAQSRRQGEIGLRREHPRILARFQENLKE